MGVQWTGIEVCTFVIIEWAIDVCSAYENRLRKWPKWERREKEGEESICEAWNTAVKYFLIRCSEKQRVILHSAVKNDTLQESLL